MIDLLSTTSLVEAPFIIVQIGNYTFGAYNKQSKNIISSDFVGNAQLTTFPNYMESLSVQKINGSVNQYTIVMVYPVTAGQDPNMLEKVFGSVSKTREIKISYGDFSSPTFIFKEEDAIITKITSQVDLKNYCIRYTLSCTSNSLSLAAGSYQFPARRAKPSDVIKEILFDTRYGILDVLYGLKNKDLFLSKGYIAVDDKEVEIPAKSNMSVFQYLSYLVDCMVSLNDSSNSVIRTSKYMFSVYDDINNELGGPYLKIIKIVSSESSNSLDTYSIDIGYPSENYIYNFTISNDETYSILYNFSENIEQTDYCYRINDEGQTEAVYAPILTNSTTLYKTTEANKTWWTNVTQYPIKATVEMKGLLRPAILMTYVRLNTYFFGRKHISSGLYVVTKQIDSVSKSGYKTTLSLTRVGGDN